MKLQVLSHTGFSSQPSDKRTTPWSLHCNFDITEDSEDEKEDHKNVRQQRQAASKAASKQREMLMEDVGSEEEQEEEDETPFQESTCRWLGTWVGTRVCDRDLDYCILVADRRYSQPLKFGICYQKRWLFLILVDILRASGILLILMSIAWAQLLNQQLLE